MEEKQFPENPLGYRHMMPAMWIGTITSLIGAAVIYWGPKSWTLGIAVTVGGMVWCGYLVLRLIRNLPCPTCTAKLRHDKASASFVCDSCQVAWTL